MKKEKMIFFEFFILLILLISFKPSVNAQVLIKGQLIDTFTHAPLQFATIVAAQNTDSNKIYSSSTADTSGRFHLKIERGKYELTFSFVGYLKRLIELDANQDKEIDLGIILMNPNSKELKEVKIIKEKPLFNFRPGKIIYEVQNDPRSIGKNGLQILRQAPLVSVTGDGSILLKGRSNFLIQLNGKIFRTGNPTQFLRSVNYSQIENIEIITNPSAKYSAEGIAGIINITMKKPRLGNFGSVYFGYDNYNSSSLGGNLMGKKGKVGYSFMVSGNLWRNGTYDYFLNQQIGDKTIFLRGHTIPKRNSLLGLGSLSYQLNKKNIFNIDMNAFYGKGNIRQSFSNGTIPIYTTSFLQDKTFSTEVNWEHTIDSLHSFVFSYKLAPQSNTNKIEKASSTAVSNGSSFANTFQLDFKSKNLEYGSKISLSPLHSNIDQNQENSIYAFQQNIYAVYVSYDKSIHSYNVEAGVRGEYTYINSLKNKDSVFYHKKYAQLFPTVSIDRSFTKSKINLSLGYSKRISRPQLYYLNPFINVSNPNFYSGGNSILKPELSHNIELRFTKHTKKNNYHIIAFSYQLGKNSIENFIFPRNDSILQSVFVNFKEQQLLGISVYSNFSIFKKIRVTTSNNFYWTLYPKSILGYSKNDSNYIVGNNGFFGSFSLSFSGKLFKKIQWQFSNSLTLPEVYLQGHSSSFFYQDVTLSSFFLKNKLLGYVSVRQPFTYQYDYKVNNSSPYFMQSSENITPQRRIFIGVNYSFGKPHTAKVQTRKKIKEDEKKSKNINQIIK